MTARTRLAEADSLLTASRVRVRRTERALATARTAEAEAVAAAAYAKDGVRAAREAVAACEADFLRVPPAERCARFALYERRLAGLKAECDAAIRALDEARAAAAAAKTARLAAATALGRAEGRSDAATTRQRRLNRRWEALREARAADEVVP